VVLGWTTISSAFSTQLDADVADGNDLEALALVADKHDVKIG